MTYYIEHENKIVLFDTDKSKLQQTLLFMPQYQGKEIKETERPIADFEFADSSEYIVQQAASEKAARVQELQAQLEELDLKSLRALRAVGTGQDTPEDHERLAQLEAQAVALRAQLMELSK
ncbi:MAG: hypothetical protein IKN49_03575 [Elusimicrobiaceae bacterium]|nr:hypothetical protein [Elusimicrobiaceae bacterium]